MRVPAQTPRPQRRRPSAAQRQQWRPGTGQQAGWAGQRGWAGKDAGWDGAGTMDTIGSAAGWRLSSTRACGGGCSLGGVAVGCHRRRAEGDWLFLRVGTGLGSQMVPQIAGVATVAKALNMSDKQGQHPPAPTSSAPCCTPAPGHPHGHASVRH